MTSDTTTVLFADCVPLMLLEKSLSLILVHTTFCDSDISSLPSGMVVLWEEAVLLAQGMQVQRNACYGSSVNVSMGNF